MPSGQRPNYTIGMNYILYTFFFHHSKKYNDFRAFVLNKGGQIVTFNNLITSRRPLAPKC